jgi:hypothetical protein
MRTIKTTRRALTIVVGLAIAAAATGCTGATAAPSHTPAATATMTAQQIADLLAPLGCEAKPQTDSNWAGGITPKAELECTINGEHVNIAEYLNAEQVAATLNLAKSLGCVIAKGFGVTGDQDYVTGLNWLVDAQTASTSQAIKTAVGDGATIGVTHCS